MTKTRFGNSPISPITTTPELTTILVLFLLLVGVLPAAVDAGTPDCGTGSPIFPAPQLQQGIFLWPPNGFQPANPGVQIPAERDSSTFIGNQLPGAASGLEFFTDLDIAGDHAYVAHNSGFAIWEIAGASAAIPNRLDGSVRDGWLNDFCSFPIISGLDYHVFDIAYVADGAGEMVALAGLIQVGLTLWDVGSKVAPSQLYQDTTRAGHRVRTVDFNNTAYAFYGTLPLGNTGGLHVYDMSAAATCSPSPPDCGSTCPDVYLGELGDWSSVRYVSVLRRVINAQERLFVAVSDGFDTTTLGVEIHEVTNLVPEMEKIGSQQIFSGLDTQSLGVELFEVGGNAYLAVKGVFDVKIYDVTACLASNDCTNLQNDIAKWSIEVGFSFASEEFVTFSQTDDGHPFLYYGNDKLCLRGTKKEGLYDLSDLGAAIPIIPEATDGGETYLDPNHGEAVDYWGSYYDGNTGGFNRIAPRVAKVRRDPDSGKTYVYRAANHLFDVHQIGGEVNGIFADGFESDDLSRWSSSSQRSGRQSGLQLPENPITPVR